MPGFQPKIYKTDSGNKLVVESGGTIQVKSGGILLLGQGAIFNAEAFPQAYRTGWFEDFEGDVLKDQWSGAKGSDGDGVVPTIVAGSQTGKVRLTSGNDGTDGADLCILTHALNWKANQGGLTMVCRFQISAITAAYFFVGFTDVLATTTVEAPATLSGTSYTTAASDACGLMFDTAATTDTIRAVGVAADVDATHVDTSIAPVAATDLVVRIDLSTAGVMTAYINGTLVATVAGAVTPTVLLTPVVAVSQRATTARTLDVEYLGVSALRP